MYTPRRNAVIGSEMSAMGVETKHMAASQPSKSVKTRRMKYLLLASAKGGSGKSTHALNLAVCASHSGIRTAVVDFDRQATLSNSIGRRPPEAPAIDVYAVPISQAAEGLAEIETEDAVDLVVLDTPPGVEDHPEAMQLLLRKADFVLVPTGAGTPDLDSTIEWMSIVKRAGVQGAFVLNKTKRATKRTERAKTRLVKAGHLCPIDVRSLEDIESTHDAGVGVIEISGAKGSDDFDGVWAYVRGQLGI
jgi:chromosome partitioning protein